MIPLVLTAESTPWTPNGAKRPRDRVGGPQFRMDEGQNGDRECPDPRGDEGDGPGHLRGEQRAEKPAGADDGSHGGPDEADQADVSLKTRLPGRLRRGRRRHPTRNLAPVGTGRAACVDAPADSVLPFLAPARPLRHGETCSEWSAGETGTRDSPCSARPARADGDSGPHGRRPGQVVDTGPSAVAVGLVVLREHGERQRDDPPPPGRHRRPHGRVQRAPLTPGERGSRVQRRVPRRLRCSHFGSPGASRKPSARALAIPMRSRSVLWAYSRNRGSQMGRYLALAR
ncbi:hypothetical protein SHXM_09956 [Streptomyces hygroscopicus]|nr:hypothetical protein SHXM_09956 [Streptomyces hygroscopicus]